MDIKTAFLNSELEETVYMEIPEDISIPTAPASAKYQAPMVCRLLISIYGLKQSPRAWYRWIHSFFLAHSDFNHSLFIYYEKAVVLLLYVDDLVLASPINDSIDCIRTMLHQ